ncbi:HAD-like domain-containing protein [Peziza echinospora]|nr:HAD-like domain-containing protein [Peziza echinospora]
MDQPRRPNPSRMASVNNLTLKGTAHGSAFASQTSHDALTSGEAHPSAPPPTAAKVIDSGLVHGFNHKNCQAEEAGEHVVATLFHTPPKSPSADTQPEASATHISQAALFDFIGTWDKLFIPWRKWDSSHRCLDSSTVARRIELVLPLPSNLTLADLRRHEEIATFEQRWNIEVVLQPHNVFRKHKRLAVFDMDSTLIQQEVIDEIARYVGLEEQVSAITRRAMNGELDFTASLKARVALLKGVPATVFEDLKSVITFTPGARELCKALKALGFKLAVLSGGFIPLATHVKAELGLDYAYANQLVLNPDGTHLTGDLTGPIIHAEAKASLLAEIAQKEGISLAQTLAIGDGANDLKMMGLAGLGIAFDAKPKVQELAPCRLNSGNLRDVLYILGLTRGEQEDLLAL